MQKTIAIVVVALFAAAAMPNTLAQESVSSTYDVPGGAYRLNSATGCGDVVPACGPGLSWRIGDETWEDGYWCLEDEDECEQVIDPLAATVFGTARDVALSEDGFNIGVQLRSSDCGDCYTDFSVSIVDALPTQSYYTFCVITDYQDGLVHGDEETDTWCGDNPTDDPAAGFPGDDIADPRVAGCGSLTLSSPVASGGDTNEGVAFVYASHVDETSGNVCLASTGTFTVSMA